MIDAFSMVEKESSKVGLQINEAKTKYMKMSRDERRRQPQDITIDRYTFQGVISFEYLGVMVKNDNSIKYCIQERIKAGNKCLFAYKKLMQSRLLTRETKLLIYKTIIRPVVTYGCEVWTLNMADENDLRIFERKILRKIYGPIRVENGDYRRRNNAELNEIIKNEDIIRFSKSQRLRWAGHTVRMQENRMPYKILHLRPILNRARGRPRTRWEGNIENDYWKLEIMKAKAHTEL